MSISKQIVADFIANDVRFVTTVPCKQLGGVIDEVEARPEIHHVPANKEDEGMGLLSSIGLGLALAQKQKVISIDGSRGHS